MVDIVLSPEEKKAICGKCEDKVECDFVCSDAEWHVIKRRQNQRLAAKKYPEQSPYVRGNKVWLNLPTGQELIISAQARAYMDAMDLNEEKFIQKLKELLKECFYDYHPENKEWLFKADRLSVSEVAFKWEEPDDDTGRRPTHLQIDIYELCGHQRKDVASLNETGEKREE